MTLRQFIRENQQQLREHIDHRLSFVPRTASCDCHKSGTDHQHASKKLTMGDVKDWIMNDENLYQWAIDEGVRL